MSPRPDRSQNASKNALSKTQCVNHLYAMFSVSSDADCKIGGGGAGVKRIFNTYNEIF